MRILSYLAGRRHGVALAAVAAAVMMVPAGRAVPSVLVADPAPAAQWSATAVNQLIESIQASRAEGLHPSDYGLAALRRTAEQGEGAALDALANASALQLAHDYYFGRVSDRSDMQWMIERSPYEAQQLPDRLHDAVQANRVSAFFAALLPSDPRYAALREALANASDKSERDLLRVNMERWRWMPRSIASDYLYVNVPSYQLAVMRGGMQMASYDVVVGAKDTPTPLMVTPATSLVVNPSWYVPASIVKKSGLRPGHKGFIFKPLPGGGYRAIQPPGPRNALGRIKFNLDNDQAIYLHDTNAKAAFNRDERALSHGCIRVKDIDQLASALITEGGDPGALDEALAGNETETLRLPQAWPVYIVYFTADANATGAIATYGDPYGYDARVLAGLDGEPVQIASN